MVCSHVLSSHAFRLFSISSQTKLQETKWFQHVHLVLKGASRMAKLLQDGYSVLVHCSHGWDRTAQLTSLAQLLLDPYYRTIRGFEQLVEKVCILSSYWTPLPLSPFSSLPFLLSLSSAPPLLCSSFLLLHILRLSSRLSVFILVQEWIAFGHQTSHRAGHLVILQSMAGDTPSPHLVEEESPIFVQFIDACFQLTSQFPTAFEFNDTFLLALVDAYFSCQVPIAFVPHPSPLPFSSSPLSPALPAFLSLITPLQYGTFLGNNEKERLEMRVKEKTTSLWSHINDKRNRNLYTNTLYIPDRAKSASSAFFLSVLLFPLSGGSCS